MNLKHVGLAVGLALLAGGGFAMSRLTSSCGSCASDPVVAVAGIPAQERACASSCYKAMAAEEIDVMPSVVGVAFTPAADAPRAADVYVVAFHASWCPKCKVLGPKVDELKKRLAGKPILWTGVDRSDSDSTQAEYTVSALDLGGLWAEHGKGPGFALVVKASDKTLLATLKSDASVDDMAKAIDAALAQSK